MSDTSRDEAELVDEAAVGGVEVVLRGESRLVEVRLVTVFVRGRLFGSAVEAVADVLALMVRGMLGVMLGVMPWMFQVVCGVLRGLPGMVRGVLTFPARA